MERDLLEDVPKKNQERPRTTHTTHCSKRTGLNIPPGFHGRPYKVPTSPTEVKKALLDFRRFFWMIFTDTIE